jgi:NADH:ubiquinone oxidoreductase subunit F (NADH-binding)
VCNAAEGEPGTFKDRYLLLKNPYATLEGLYIAAYVLKAKAIYIGIKASFQRQIQRMRQAIGEIQGTMPVSSVDIQIVSGPEEYLFGEEKAMLTQIESGLPLPREAHYPPYEKGLFATPGSPNPALVNNAETFAHIPSIIRCGASGFRGLGSSDTPGTVLFTISGDVMRPGVYEVEAGVPLRKLIDDIAGGPTDGGIKAVLSGFSAGVLPGSQIDTPADFGSLSKAGSGLGSAGFIVLNNERSMVRVAQAVARFLYVESCNQCPACKHGLRVASEILDGSFYPGEQEHASTHDIDHVLFGAHSAPQANRCYLPVQGSVVISSLIHHFRSEFDAQFSHVAERSAPYPVPLMVEFDEAEHRFVYDMKFAAKNPDWTYKLPIAS